MSPRLPDAPRLLLAILLAGSIAFGLSTCGGGGGGGGDGGSVPDTTPPTVVSTSPDSDATNVALLSVVSVTFSEALDPRASRPPPSP